MALEPAFAGCEWPVDPACLTEQWEALDPDVKERSLAMASETLRRLTAYRVGGCPITVRPCKPECCIPGLSMFWDGRGTPFYPYNWNGSWRNCGCGGNTCKSHCEVELPAPVGEITEIIVDGTTMDLTDFRVDNGNILVYTGSGDCPFNMAQDLSLPLTEEGTWGVTYSNSYPVDALGAYAVGLLAMEFAKACTGAKCRLPAGVTTVVRNGVTMDITPGAFPDGFTGIREIDTFISLWKPPGSPDRSPTVYSPDLPQYRHVTRRFT